MICHYCGADHASDIICQQMFMSHADAFVRLNQANPTCCGQMGIYHGCVGCPRRQVAAPENTNARKGEE